MSSTAQSAVIHSVAVAFSSLILDEPRRPHPTTTAVELLLFLACVSQPIPLLLSPTPCSQATHPRARRHSLPPSSSSPSLSQRTLPPTPSPPSPCPPSPSSLPTAPGPSTGASQSLTSASEAWPSHPSSSVESTDDTPLTPIGGTCHDLLIPPSPAPVTIHPLVLPGAVHLDTPHAQLPSQSLLPSPLPPPRLAYHPSSRLPSHCPHLDRQQTRFSPLP